MDVAELRKQVDALAASLLAGRVLECSLARVYLADGCFCIEPHCGGILVLDDARQAAGRFVRLSNLASQFR